jgi:hypothetical protein
MSGHGHVIPNADGSKARCGGPGFCPDCAAEHLRGLSVRPVAAVGEFLSIGDGGDRALDLLRKAFLILPPSITRDEITAFLARAPR